MLKALSLAAVALLAPLPQTPQIEGVTLLFARTELVNGQAYVISVLSNNTALSIRMPAGEGGVINLPDVAVVALPGATRAQIAATTTAAYEEFEDQSAIWIGSVGELFPVMEILLPGQGITGGEYPVEIHYSYLTPAGTGAATIDVTVRGQRSRSDPGALARTLQDHVKAIQRVFPAR